MEPTEAPLEDSSREVLRSAPFTLEQQSGYKPQFPLSSSVTAGSGWLDLAPGYQGDSASVTNRDSTTDNTQPPRRNSWDTIDVTPTTPVSAPVDFNATFTGFQLEASRSNSLTDEEDLKIQKFQFNSRRRETRGWLYSEAEAETGHLRMQSSGRSDADEGTPTTEATDTDTGQSFVSHLPINIGFISPRVDFDSEKVRSVRIACNAIGSQVNLTFLDEATQGLNSMDVSTFYGSPGSGGATQPAVFSDSDVIIVDFADAQSMLKISYFLGVRASLNRFSTIIMTKLQEESLFPFKQSEYVYVKYDDDFNIVGSANGKTLSQGLIKTLRVMKSRIIIQERETRARDEVKRVRAGKDERIRRIELCKIESEMDHKYPLTATILCELNDAFKSVMEYERIVMSLERWAGHEALALEALEGERTRKFSDQNMRLKLRYQYSFAIIKVQIVEEERVRLNWHRALHVMLQEVIPNHDGCTDQERTDHVCLVGRIFKDMFTYSGLKSAEALESAIFHYRQAFQIAHDDYPGLNLANLMIRRGESPEESPELAAILLSLQYSLGSKGELHTLKSYWDVASVFELAVLTSNLPWALQAAWYMYKLEPDAWAIKSTMDNVRIVLATTPMQRRWSKKVSNILSSLRDLLDFWLEMFDTTSPATGSTAAEGSTSNLIVPILVAEPKGGLRHYHACKIEIRDGDRMVHMYNVSECLPDKDGTKAWIDAVGTAVPTATDCVEPVQTSWEFTATEVKNVEKMEDKRLTLVTSQYIFPEILFPSSEIRDRFCAKLKAILDELGQAKSTEKGEIRFSYEMDRHGWKRLLGKGTYGNVYSATDSSTGRKMAVKEIVFHSPLDVHSLKLAQNEIQIQVELKHENIVRLLGSELWDNLLLVFMEQVPGACNLNELVTKEWENLLGHMNILRDYSMQILKGLRYVHRKGFVHLDIKGENVMVDRFKGVLKVTDFGASETLKKLSSGEGSDRDTSDSSGASDDNDKNEPLPPGTPGFQAPEVITMEPGWTAKSPADIWSYGCLVIEITTGKYPFHDVTESAIMHRVGTLMEHPTIPDELDECARNFIERCFAKDEKDRPSANDLLEDPFLNLNARRRTREAAEKTALAMSHAFAGVKTDLGLEEVAEGIRANMAAVALDQGSTEKKALLKGNGGGRGGTSLAPRTFSDELGSPSQFPTSNGHDGWFDSVRETPEGMTLPLRRTQSEPFGQEPLQQGVSPIRSPASGRRTNTPSEITENELAETQDVFCS